MIVRYITPSITHGPTIDIVFQLDVLKPPIVQKTILSSLSSFIIISVDCIAFISKLIATPERRILVVETLLPTLPKV